MAEIITREKQSIYDLAVQAYGDISGVFPLMEDNPELNLTDEIVLGSLVSIRDEALDEEVKKYIDRYHVIPANAGGKDPLISAFSDGFNQEAFR